MKLFTRYNRISLPIILGIFIASGIGCFFWVEHILIADFDDNLIDQSQKISSYADKNGEFPKLGLTDDWVIAYQKSTTFIPRRIETMDRYDPEEKENTKYRTLIYTYRKKGQYYLISISKSLEALEGLSRSIAMMTMFALLAVIAVTLLLSHFVLKKLWRPFYHTLDLLREFKLGKQEKLTFDETHTDEFNFMNLQLNNMIGNAEKEYTLLREFTDNASHEMQTPISILRSKLDIVVQGENLTEQQTLAMESAYQSVRRLTNLGQSLLLLSKIENEQFNEVIHIDLDGKIKGKITQLEEIWQEKEITVNLRSEPAQILCNADLLDILLNNVLSNSSRHNVQGGTIDIYLKQGELIVSNTSSMEPIDPLRIFSRFYKQRRYSMNNGLGLAIIKQICDQSNISVSYQFIDQLHSFRFTWPNSGSDSSVTKVA